jgi:hypothetical protein
VSTNSIPTSPAAGRPAEVIQAALDATADAFRALWDAKAQKAPMLERNKLRLQADMAAMRSNLLQDQAPKAFAASRGWRLSKGSAHSFDYPQTINHAQFFKDSDGRRVGLVSHTRASRDQIARYAAANGYNAEVLPFSWYSPRWNTAVLFTLRAGARWPGEPDPNLLTEEERALKHIEHLARIVRARAEKQ